jgi:Recombination, repair and ssDNA binding protein UvsY
MQTPPLEEVMKQWEKDSEVDITEPGREIIRIPILHNKYNKYLSLHNLSAKKAEIEFAKMKKLKWLYYTGKLDQDELDKLGWEPFRFTLKSDIGVYLDADDDLNKLKRKHAYHEEAASFCTNVMKEISNRTWQLKEYIGWEKFVQGAR